MEFNVPDDPQTLFLGLLVADLKRFDKYGLPPRLYPFLSPARAEEFQES